MRLTLRKRPVEMASFSRACSRRSRDLATKSYAESETGAQPWYCSSLTFSIHSTALPSSASWMAMWVMAVVGAAPCQCFSPGAKTTTSPGRISSIGPPSRCARPQPGSDDEDLTKRVRMPGGARAGLERDRIAGGPRGSGHWKQRVDADHAGEIFRWSLGRCARTRSLDLHPLLLMWRGRRAPAGPMAVISSRAAHGWASRMSLFAALRP